MSNRELMDLYTATKRRMGTVIESLNTELAAVKAERDSLQLKLRAEQLTVFSLQSKLDDHNKAHG